MQFTPSEEQEELRRLVRRFMDDKSPEAEVRRLMEDEQGYDEAVWRQLNEQLGLCSLAIPEEYGGSGFSFVELCLVAEELGRRLYTGPWFSSAVLAAETLLQSGDTEAMGTHLPGIAGGEDIATLALTEESSRWDEEGITCEARRTGDGDGWALYGEKWYVTDGMAANLALVVARTDKGVSLFAVELGEAKGFNRAPQPTMDRTRGEAKYTFDSTPASLVGNNGGAWKPLARALDRAAVALAAEQLGGMQLMFDVTLQYLKERYQFGRPIGSFQALKHRMADLLVELESSRSAVAYGANVAAEGDKELEDVAPMTKAYVSEAYWHMVCEAIQMHGGIGFTWEHPAHLYFKRAATTKVFLGDPTYQRSLLGDRLGL